MEKYNLLLEQLCKKEIEKIEVPKDEFIAFREVLIQHPKFKHFRGEARQGGAVTYTFLDVPRA